MKPLKYSKKEATSRGHGWARGCEGIVYYQNSLRRKSGGYYYSLSFSTKFKRRKLNTKYPR
jgi:hypothetical protein